MEKLLERKHFAETIKKSPIAIIFFSTKRKSPSESFITTVLHYYCITHLPWRYDLRFPTVVYLFVLIRRIPDSTVRLTSKRVTPPIPWFPCRFVILTGKSSVWPKSWTRPMPRATSSARQTWKYFNGILRFAVLEYKMPNYLRSPFWNIRRIR